MVMAGNTGQVADLTTFAADLTTFRPCGLDHFSKSGQVWHSGRGARQLLQLHNSYRRNYTRIPDGAPTRTWSTLKRLPCERPVPMGAPPRVRGLKTPRPHGRPAKPPRAGRTPPVGLSGGRATTCGQRPQWRQGDMRTASRRGGRAHQAGRAPRAVGAGGSSSSPSGSSTVAMSLM